VDLKTEITKQQDCRQKLEQDFLQLQRVRSIINHLKKTKTIRIFQTILGILIKKLKRRNRSHACSNSNNNLLDKSSSNTIQIESI
jgi:hypothetical protein